jgi:hypothetical protein
MIKGNSHNAKQVQMGLLHIDCSGESSEALKVLHAAGIYFTSVPVSGTIGPELKVGTKVYYGLNEIVSFVNGSAKSLKQKAT